MRVTGPSAAVLSILQREGIELRDFVEPNTRIRHRAMIELIEMLLQQTGDPLLGLRAGGLAEVADFAALGYACSSAATLREAIDCAGRYMHLLHGAQEARLVEDGSNAIWQLRITDGVQQVPAVNEFALSCACWLTRRYAVERRVLREVHFTHGSATDIDAYERVFGGATIKLGRPNNALVFERFVLETPMAFAHSGLKSAFEAHADQLLESVSRSDTVSVRVRRLIVKHIANRDANMLTIAQSMSMSEPTLRRRLAEEGTSYSDVLESVRSELANHYFADRKFAAADVASLLGFSHVSGLYKAFRRWTEGGTPAKVRKNARGDAAASADLPPSTPDVRYQAQR
jgi:AraC-like DNA-binding protein